MKNSRVLVAVGSLLCVGSVISCSKALTRPQAAKLIESQQRLPRPQTISFSDSYLKRSWSNPIRGFGKITLCIHEDNRFADAESRLTYYQSQGLLNISFQRVEGDCPAIYAKVSLTDAGRKHLVAARDGSFEVRAFNLALGEVTGIQSQEQLKKATAEYTLQFADVTPFGGNLSRDPIRATAALALFDDGWRIEPSDLISAPMRYEDPPDTSSLQEAKRAIAGAEAAVEAADLIRRMPPASLLGVWKYSANQTAFKIEQAADGTLRLIAPYEVAGDGSVMSWRDGLLLEPREGAMIAAFAEDGRYILKDISDGQLAYEISWVENGTPKNVSQRASRHD